MIYVSLLIYIVGGVWALRRNDPRIAASTTSIAYIVILTTL
jgi:hypothetical protein